MSSIQNLTKSQKKRQKRAEKRKASGSPGTIEGGHCTPEHTSKSPSETTNATDFFQVSNDYVQSVMSTPIMNYNGQYPVGMQIPQTPQTPSVFQNSSIPPNWAVSLIEDVKSIKSALPKIDQIEQSVNSIKLQITVMETKVSTLEAKCNDIEKSVSFITDEYDSQKNEIKKSKKDLEKLNNLCTSMDRNIQEYQKREEKMQDKLLDLEARSMRENLIFYGLEEPHKRKQNEPPLPDNCEKLVKELINDTLEIDTTDMVFDRIHRLGSERAKKPRPIVVKFEKYTDREEVRQKSYEEDFKNKLKAKKQGVGTQSPQQYREARKVFSDYIKEQKLEESARIVGNKLYVNNKVTKRYIDGKITDYSEH